MTLWFNSNFATIYNTEIAPGQSWQVRAIIRHNGTACLSSSVKVSFYASANTVINTSDFKIGDVTVSTLDPLINCPDGLTTTVRGGQWRFNWQT